MSQRAYQAVLARLVLEADLRDRVRSEGMGALGSGLSGLEQRRLIRIAADRGLELTVFLVRGFRLGKLLTLLPLTGTLLGPELLAAEARLFWQSHPPTSFYFLEEALAFSNHLVERARGELRVLYLDEVVAYERAILVLSLARLLGSAPSAERVQFSHDPVRLLEALGAGERPSGVPERECSFVATLGIDEAVQWVPVLTMMARGDF